jgi:hypothetical protein
MRRAETFDLSSESRREFGRRVNKEPIASKAHNGHARREWKLEKRRPEMNYWPIDQPNVFRHRFQRVDG